MIQCLYFAAGRLFFGLVGRHDSRFVIRELLGGLAFLVLAVPTLSIPEPFWRGVVTGIAFLATGVLVLLFVDEPPPKSEDTKVKTHSPVKIIDLSWTGIMAGTLAAAVFAQASPTFIGVAAPGRGSEFYQAMLENVRFLMDHTVNFVLALGGVLSACMAILWAGEIWRTDQEHEYRKTTLAAAKMVFAFFWIVTAIGAWILLPLFSRLTSLPYLMK
jgi:hypothetical protein